MSLRARFAGAALLALGLALPAAGAPLQMWLQPNGSFGFSSQSTSAASAAGVISLPDSTFFSNSSGQRISVTTPPSIRGTSFKKASFTRPSNGTSTWTVTALDRDYQDLWIVIQGHDPNDPLARYYDQNHKIGLVIDPATDPNWALVRPAGTPGVTYLAYHVGDLEQGDSFDVPISYVVAKALKVVNKKKRLCVFPQYRVNFLELAVVPEPLTLSLLAASGALLAVRKLRTR